jgi:hypothetical protein
LDLTEAQQRNVLAHAEALRQKVQSGNPTLAQKRELLRSLDLQVTFAKGLAEMTGSYILGTKTVEIEKQDYRTLFIP